MSIVSITLVDQEDGVDVKTVSSPEFPRNENEASPAQLLTIHMILELEDVLKKQSSEIPN